MIALELDDLRGAFGLGVAGNFAGHLEQAGESGDFVSVATVGEAPKGVFPFFAPGSGTFLEAFPIAHDRLALPASPTALNLQIEPEVGLVCGVEYAADGRVQRLLPRVAAAFNDCSIRREGAAKISHKKNWGPASKGLAPRGFPITDLATDAAQLRLTCFLRRDGVAHAYGVDSPVPGYTYFGAQLLDWMAERLREQRGAPGTPLEDVGALLRGAGSPATVVIGIGATRYTPLGAQTFLGAGDVSLVVVYDAAVTPAEAVVAAVAAGEEDGLAAASVLRQTVELGPPAPALPAG